MNTQIAEKLPLKERVLASRVKRLSPSGIRKFFDIINSMPEVISLGVGEPDFDTPKDLVEAGIKSLSRGETHYTSNRGTMELRKAISCELQEQGVYYDPETEIIVTVGVSEALDLALRCTCEAGDEFIIPEPSYVAYEPVVQLSDGVTHFVATRMDDDFALNPADLESAITDNTKAVLLASPANPTGSVMSHDDQDRVARTASERDLLVITDEIYCNLVYDGHVHRAFSSLPGMRERTILMGGFSKSDAMTGWRVGYVAAPDYLVEAMLKIHQYTIMSAPTTGQHVALAALHIGEKDRKRMLNEYDRRRRFFVEGLNRIGLPTVMPKGAFYTFPLVSGTGLSSEEFSNRLLFEGKVAVVPGNVFGRSGEGHVRACYATSYENLRNALERIDRFVQGL